MNSTLAVAGRELREHSRLFVVAAAMALIPFIAAVAPAARGQRGLAVATVGMYLAVIFPCGVALTLGITAIGRELSEKRMSFYFSKPLPAASIWTGKLMSGLLISFAAMAIIAVPAALTSWKSWRVALANVAMLWAAVACVVLFLLGHALSTVIRSRSALLAVDFALLAVTLFVLTLIVRPVVMGGALETAVALSIGVACAFGLLLAVAPVWQLANGRIDPRRNHAAFSRAFWPAAAVILLIASAISLWIVRAPLSSVREIAWVEQTADGRRVFVSGAAANRGGYVGSYLVDTATGETTRLALAPWYPPSFSRDGSASALIELASIVPGRMVLQARVSRLDGKGQVSAFPIPATVSRSLVLSEDGSKVAIASTRDVTVYDVASRKILMTGSLDGRMIAAMFFPTPGVLRLISHEDGFVIREMDLASRRLIVTGRAAGTRSMVAMSDDGSRMYLRKDSAIVDGRTGQAIATLPVRPGTNRFSAAMLSDGSVAVAAGHALHLFDRDGRPLRQIALPVERATISGEVGDARLLLRGREATYVVNLHRGVLESTLPGLRAPFMLLGADPRITRFPADATLTMVDLNKRPVLWNAGTGERKAFPM